MEIIPFTGYLKAIKILVFAAVGCWIISDAKYKSNRGEKNLIKYISFIVRVSKRLTQILFVI